LVLSEAVVFHFHRQFKILKDIYDGSKDVSPTTIRCTFQFPEFARGDFRNDVTLGGGAVWDLCAYALSVGRALFGGLPRRVEAIELHEDSHGLIAGFLLVARYEGRNTLVGSFGTGFFYENSLELANRNSRVILQKPFSLSHNEPGLIRTISDDGVHEMSLSPDDSFFNYLSWVMKVNDASVVARHVLLETIWTAVGESVHEVQLLLQALKRH